MFTLRGSDNEDTDLVATVDGRTTVGDLAEHLVLADPQRQHAGSSHERADWGQMTPALVNENFRAVDPHTTVQESGLRSGAHVSVTRRSSGYRDTEAPIAVATVVAGPDTGREYALQRGTSHVGRGRDCEVQINDASVSRRHAKLLVADVVEVTDLGSSNGVVVGDEHVDRAILREGEAFTIGDTTFEISTRTAAAGVTTTESGDVAFTRSPRISPVYRGLQFEVPDLPERGKPQRIPLAMMIVPVFMGATLFAITRSRFTIMFMLMMPMMMLANVWESKRRVRLDFEEAMVDFREDVGYLVEDIETELDREHDTRRREHPAVAELGQAVAAHHPLMWTRRPGEPGYLEYRLGSGVRPSRSEIKLPKMGRSRAEARLEVSTLMQGLGVVADVPVTAHPLLDGAIGVSGPREAALGLARSIIVQTMAAHSPAEVVLCALASTTSARDWDWLKWVPHATSPQSPFDVQQTASSRPGCAAIMEQLESLVASRSGADGAGAAGPSVVVLVENDAPLERARLVQLAEAGWKVGVVVVWVSPVTEQLPAACRTFVEVGDDARCRVGWVGPAQLAADVHADLIPLRDAVTVARQLAPITDSSAPGPGRLRHPTVGVLPRPRRHGDRPLGDGRHREVEREPVDPHRAARAGHAQPQAGLAAGRHRAVRDGHAQRGPAHRRTARPRRWHHGRRQVGAAPGPDPRHGHGQQPAAGDLPPRRLQGRVRLPRLRPAAAHRRHGHRPLAPPGAKGVGLAVGRAALPRAPAGPFQGEGPGSSSSDAARSRPRPAR
uniref:FHA domain-containing protein n=1 Tax=Janibacter limosus TaxID=53458 RepID=A0AC61U4A3_9MICO|nr:FHA domain-containing protein [Janibacter limosus]